VIGKTATIVCQDGWKYTGKVLDVNMSLSGVMAYVKIQTQKGYIIVNAQFIVSMLYEED